LTKISEFPPLEYNRVLVLYDIDNQAKRGETDKLRRERRAATSVGFTVAMETMSGLFDTCF